MIDLTEAEIVALLDTCMEWRDSSPEDEDIQEDIVSAEAKLKRALAAIRGPTVIEGERRKGGAE